MRVATTSFALLIGIVSGNVTDSVGNRIEPGNLQRLGRIH